MNSKLLFLTCALVALLGAAPLAVADGETKSTKGSSADSSGDDLLKQLSDDSSPLPDAGDVFAANDLTGEFFPEEDTSEEENVKYVYKGAGSDITLGHPIRDYRVDDGYVQGLMQQRGSD
ncbi:MAG: hypothetical protein EBQ96_09260 [Proteobacteria bacterium]|nr:hypothetical protein [Pseudomonadota bacterium]